MSWVLDNLELIAGLTLEHLRQSLVPIAIGWLFAFVVVVSSHVIICKETENERILHH